MIYFNQESIDKAKARFEEARVADTNMCSTCKEYQCDCHDELQQAIRGD